MVLRPLATHYVAKQKDVIVVHIRSLKIDVMFNRLSKCYSPLAVDNGLSPISTIFPAIFFS